MERKSVGMKTRKRLEGDAEMPLVKCIRDSRENSSDDNYLMILNHHV